ncbi:AAA family ATPase [Actinomyces sp. 186855]|nr:AAA family ATPase [Actinomyces sp. AC-20-1]MCL3790820.1 AAA family ATPase [Actinomyces sp. 187325]MCL3792694.1 AAA family ATPase [Actinomyces sp. 186855]MCL3795561.1 AAA family ATPase [Actinomyces sp. 217892]
MRREAQRTARIDARPTSPEEDVARAGELVKRVTKVFSQRVVGQDQLRVSLLSTLIAGGHVLLESVPGLAKTTAAQTLASAVSGSFRRIQCTPDLMPNDIVGTQVLNYATGEMTTQLGPVHANIVLLDEINRSSAKTQSAMLEAMQERQTSIGGVIYPLPHPFMVLATQNPIEEEGTYVLPEAQMDRFLMKEVLSYPRPHEEADVLDRVSRGSFDKPVTTPPITTEDVEWLQGAAERVYVDPVIKQYIVALVNTTRGGGPRPVPGIERHVRVGASPRGGIALMKVAQAIALQAGRTYVTPDDVGLLRHSVLRHRLVLTYDALADAVAPEAIIDAVFAAVPTP